MSIPPNNRFLASWRCPGVAFDSFDLRVPPVQDGRALGVVGGPVLELHAPIALVRAALHELVLDQMIRSSLMVMAGVALPVSVIVGISP